MARGVGEGSSAGGVSWGLGVVGDTVVGDGEATGWGLVAIPSSVHAMAARAAQKTTQRVFME